MSTSSASGRSSSIARRRSRGVELRPPAGHVHGPLLRAERGARQAVVVLDALDRRIDRRGVEAALPHRRDL